jgi:hypothetical protein
MTTKLHRGVVVMAVGLAALIAALSSSAAQKYTCPPQIFRSKLLASFMPTNYALAGTAASEYS